jgi:flagellar biosynthetic protein FliP
MKHALALMLILVLAQAAMAAAPGDKSFSGIELRIGGGTGGEGLTVPMQILALLTLLTLLPALFISVTSFTRLIIVSHFLRQALGTQTMPPNQVLIGLSLFLTYFIMQPVGSRINQEALEPMMKGQITQMEAMDRASVPLRDFMLRYTREKDLSLFLGIAKVPWHRQPQ